MMRWLSLLLIVVLPGVDLAWNLTHLNIGLVDFYGVTLPALGLVQNGAWPATSYFPAGYPLLLIPFGLAGSTLIGGYVLSAVGVGLALAGVRRLCLELGVSPEWSLAAVALAWAEPTFRVTAGTPTPDMLYSGLAVWFMWSAVAAWRRADPAPVWPLILLALALPVLKYQGYLLVIPVAIALIVARRVGNPFAFKQRPFDAAPPRSGQLLLGALLLSILINHVPYFLQYGVPLSSSAGLQVRVGMEMDAPIFFEDVNALYNGYGAFADFARKRPIISDYGPAALAAHTAEHLWRFLRRPPVLLAALMVVAGILSRRLQPGEDMLAASMLVYVGLLAAAYYTPYAAAPIVLAGVAVSLGLAARLVPQKPDLALGAVCVLLLVAYWPAGQFARANLAERRNYAELSRQTAELIKAEGADPRSNLAYDMRIIWLPSQGNPWQKPYPHRNKSWLNDPAIRHEQLPGYFAEPISDPASLDLPADR